MIRVKLMRVTIVSLVLVLPMVTPGGDEKRQPVERLLGAYYYPWYYKERWTREPVTNTPKLGWYSSDDRKVLAEHIRWARQADIDFFLVSWLSPDGQEGKNLRESVVPELEYARFRFAVLYEAPLALGLPAGKPIDLAGKLPDGARAGDRLVEHFDHLAQTYLKHPQYLRLAGKAVVTVYLPAARAREVLSGWEAVDEGAGRLISPPDTLDWLAIRLLGLGCDFEVHAPPELADHLAAMAARAARASSSGG